MWTQPPSTPHLGACRRETHARVMRMLITTLFIVALGGPKCPSAGELANVLCCIHPLERRTNHCYM